MKTKLTFKLIGFCILHSAFCLSTSAQGTAFTYQGRLNNNGSPANGTYDLVFTIYDLPTGPGAFANQTNAAVAVSNGLFAVTLNLGLPGIFTGPERWLEIAVRTNGGGSYSNLVPRQKITATPYAITASNLSGSISASQLSGAVPLANLPTAMLVTNGQTGVNLTGTFSGNGAGVTNLNLSLTSGGAISWPGNFLLASSPGVGSGPYSVTAADVNGDGKVDLINANLFANTLTVLTNNGSGGFVLSSSPGVGNGPVFVTTADVNGDGKVDLISANQSANTLTVLTNNGSGGFALSSSPGAGPVLYSVTAADVNGDGKVDLISANSFADMLTVLTNNGSGGFVLSSSPGVAGRPVSVTAADVNGDGKVDLISANQTASTLSVLTNNGSSGFALASSPVVGSTPNSVTAADVNGDGKVDLISANLGPDTLSVLTNNGSGGFAHSSSPSVGTDPYSVTAADVNGDGKVDLISANQTASTLSVLTNNGSGGFAHSSSPSVGTDPYSVTAADVNGDGKVDLISANLSPDTLTVLFNTPTLSGNLTGNVNAGTVNAGNVVIGTSLSFGSTLSQKIFLYGADWGLGIQSNIQYSRVGPGGGFAWYAGGVHNDNTYNAGGGATLMKLDGGGLTVNGAFVSSSDRNVKENFAPVQPGEVLAKVVALPLTRWNFKTDPDTRHLGPMAQDFYAAFGVGPDDKHIATVDADGVALAAIQGLNQKVEEQRAELRQKQTEITELKQRLEKLERFINPNGGAK